MKHLLVIFAVIILSFPQLSSANYKDEVAVWVPWFQAELGARSAIKNIRDIDTIYAFVYEVDGFGNLVNKVDFSDEHWDDLFNEADDRRVDVIPTIAWFDGEAIHEVLSDRSKRRAHIKEIVRMVDRYDFAGVDIDYEQKLAKTIDYYSTFLEELEDELGRDDLVCTIEARTPITDLYRTLPEEIEYANDYAALDEHCDRVQIMAYDQQRADLSLNDARRGVPYTPVADIDWVEKVIKLALADIDEDKIMLGVATYGRAWDITVSPDWYRDYTRVATLNQPRILELSAKYNSPVGRSAGGEAVISYFPEDSVFKVLNQLPTPADTPVGYEAAAKALFFSTAAGMEVPVRFVTWSDADAIEDKLDLVNKYNLEGVSIFKVDGEEDPDIWDLF